MTTTKDEAIKTLRDAAIFAANNFKYPFQASAALSAALAATSHIAPDAAAIQADEDNDQKRLALDSLGLGAFADFLAPSKVSPAIAPEPRELAPIKTWQERAAGQELNGSTTFSAMKAEIADLRAAIAMHRAAAAKPDALDELVNSLSAEDRAECEKVRAELLAMPIERVINMVQGNLVAAEPVPTDLPTNDEVYSEVCRERGKLSFYVSTNAVNDVMAAVRRLATKPATSEIEKMADDALRYGTGVMCGSKHIPVEDFYNLPAVPAAPTDAKQS